MPESAAARESSAGGKGHHGVDLMRLVPGAARP